VNSKTSILWRPLALAGATFIGLVAAVALAPPPASAQQATVTGTYRCVPEIAQWEVTWTVRNSQPDVAAEIVEAVYDPAHEPQTIKAGAAVPEQGTLTEVLVLPANVRDADLRVRTAWSDGQEDTDEQTLTFEGECLPAEEATVRFDPRCDGTVIVSLVNTTRQDVTFTIAANDFDETVAVPAGASAEPVVVPANAGTITVTRDGGIVDEFAYVEPKGCQPQLNVRSTCTALVITVTDPAEEWTATFTPSVGAPQQVTVASGETATVTFPGTEGLTVVITTPTVTSSELPWEEPADCGGGSLPVTGPAAGMLAGGAGGLLAAGVGVLVLARRRRVRFSA
jgi:LPXTG-motif cell wall-anchored protein